MDGRVRQHYNARPVVDVQQRRDSPIFHLKALNNFIKSQLISQHIPREAAVLDVCCGKGGDLNKWIASDVQRLVGLDIAEKSVREYEDRARAKRPRFRYDLHTVNCFKELWAKYIGNSEPIFDLASCQFALHYAFASEDQLRCLFNNLSTHLRVGGKFIGTVPNANWIVKKLRSLSEPEQQLSFGNAYYTIAFPQRDDFPLFGCRYSFQLVDAIDDLEEFLVHFPTLCRVASEYGFRLVAKSGFHEYVIDRLFPKVKTDASYEAQETARRMRVVDDRGNFPADLWDVANVYLTFCFVKEADPPAPALQYI